MDSYQIFLLMTKYNNNLVATDGCDDIRIFIFTQSLEPKIVGSLIIKNLTTHVILLTKISLLVLSISLWCWNSLGSVLMCPIIDSLKFFGPFGLEFCLDHKFFSLNLLFLFVILAHTGSTLGILIFWLHNFFAVLFTKIYNIYFCECNIKFKIGARSNNFPVQNKPG